MSDQTEHHHILADVAFGGVMCVACGQRWSMKDLDRIIRELEAAKAREEAWRKGIVALADHIQETIDAPWTGEPFKDIEDCDGSWKSLIEHEVSELRALAASEPPREEGK